MSGIELSKAATTAGAWAWKQREEPSKILR